MKCLSVCQPWAWAIIHGTKRIENRTWRTNYRGPLLIHASKTRKRLGDYGQGEPSPDQMVFGAIIGSVELLDCVPIDQVRGQPFAEGPWCLMLGNVKAFDEPIESKGRLMIYEISI